MKRLISCKKNIENLVENHKNLSSEIDNLEQYYQVLHGVNESNDTNEIIIKTFSEKLDVEIKDEDLDRSHRL